MTNGQKQNLQRSESRWLKALKQACESVEIIESVDSVGFKVWTVKTEKFRRSAYRRHVALMSAYARAKEMGIIRGIR